MELDDPLAPTCINLHALLYHIWCGFLFCPSSSSPLTADFSTISPICVYKKLPSGKFWQEILNLALTFPPTLACAVLFPTSWEFSSDKSFPYPSSYIRRTLWERSQMVLSTCTRVSPPAPGRSLIMVCSFRGFLNLMVDVSPGPGWLGLFSF